MSWLLSPLRLLWRSLTDLNFYATRLWLIPTTTLLFYTLYFFFWLALGRALLYSRFQLPKQQAFWNQTWQELKNHWPEDLVLRYDGQTVMVDPEQVLLVPYPAHWEMPTGFPENFALFSPELPSNDQSMQSLFTLTKDTLLVTSAGKTETLAVTEALGDQSWTVDRSVVESAEAGVLQTIRGVLQLGVLAFFGAAWLAVPLLRLLYLFLYTLLGQFILGLSGNALRYRQMFHLGWWLIFPTELVTILWGVLYSAPLRFAFWWVWLAFLIVIAWSFRGGRLLFMLPRKQA